MRAIVMHDPGNPEVLKLEEAAMPLLEADKEVRVQVKAAGINPVDTKLRRTAGTYPLRLPAILGFDGAGIVESVGASVTRFRPGDEVYFCYPSFGAKTGTYAEYTVVPEAFLALKPATLDFPAAAAIPLVLITAWESLFVRAHLQPQQQVLIHGGAGGVGHIAIQLARRAGARVCTTISSDDKSNFVLSLGAEEAIYYREENFSLAVLEWTDEQGVDMALDTVGGDTFEHTFTAVRYGGDLVTLLQPKPNVNWTVARQRNLRISFELMLTPAYLGIEEAQRAQGRILEECAPLFDKGELKVHVDRVFPLQEAAAAHGKLESGSQQGKLVLSMDK